MSTIISHLAGFFPKYFRTLISLIYIDPYFSFPFLHFSLFLSNIPFTSLRINNILIFPPHVINKKSTNNTTSHVEKASTFSSVFFHKHGTFPQ